MTPILTVFERSPDQGRGLARDMRVRWALEEVGQAYDTRQVSFAEMKEPEHRARQPFGQIPSWEEDGLTLFESGAIVLHIAERGPGLLPAESGARARAISWMFAALNTIEPPIVEREVACYLEGDRPWCAERLALIDARIRRRLGELAARLGDADCLDGAFTVGDLMMVTVLRRLEGSGMLADFPTLDRYIARATARPAYLRAFDAQLAVYSRSEVGG